MPDRDAAFTALILLTLIVLLVGPVTCANAASADEVREIPVQLNSQKAKAHRQDYDLKTVGRQLYDGPDMCAEVCLQANATFWRWHNSIVLGDTCECFWDTCSEQPKAKQVKK